VGDTIISEFKEEGINTDMVLRSPGSSPFTYIIVDRAGGTRTCIHTPGPECLPAEIDAACLQEVLHDASLIYFDGRLTEAALLVVKAAKR
jgi:sugar/nucleoside kinase (ribokinase family)